MDYAVLLHFDSHSEAKILKLWDEAIGCGGNPYLLEYGLRPHITLAIFEDTDVDLFCKKLGNYANSIRSFNLRLASIGTFATQQGVLYLAPIMTDELIKVHKDLYKIFEGDFKSFNSYYMPNNWVPHCSISINNSIETTALIMKRIMEIYQPIDVQVCDISIVELEPHIRYITSCRVRLEQTGEST